ncbi:OmpA family protein [Vibrio sp.]|uniref:OmpA family protein n=1 Tax=Vibrio sp. TaxID=678 RepID=UPI003D112F3F
MKLNKTLFVLTGAILNSSLVLAEQENASFLQPFIGAKAGYQWGLDDNYDHSNPRSGLWGVYGGLQFSPAWSWDLGYQQHNKLKATATGVEVKTWLIESALRYDWYLQDNLSVYGRLGIGYWEMDKMQSSLDKLDASGVSPLGEVGVSYHLSPNVRLSGGYQYINRIGKSDTGRYDSHGLLVGLSYAFGGGDSSTLVESTPTVVEDKPIVVETVETVETLPKVYTFDGTSLGNEFTFVVNSAVVGQHFASQLMEVAATLKAHPQSRAIIIGHTDSTGSQAHNQRLSERRAESVAAQLMKQGVDAKQLEVLGQGESSPVATNSTAEGRAQNRRVEITIPSFQYQQ